MIFSNGMKVRQSASKKKVVVDQWDRLATHTRWIVLVAVEVKHLHEQVRLRIDIQHTVEAAL